MFIAVAYSLLLQSAFSLHISIDGERNWNDSIDYTKEQFPSCQSLKHVAEMISNLSITSNITIEINSSLNLSGSIIFTGINGLTIKGRGAQITNIKCNKSLSKDSNGSGMVFNNCTNVTINDFAIKDCGLLYLKQISYTGLQAVLFFHCYNIMVVRVTFSNNNGTGLVLCEPRGYALIFGSTFSKNMYYTNDSLSQLDILRQKQRKTVESAGNAGGGLNIVFNGISKCDILVSSCTFIHNTAAVHGGAINIRINRETKYIASNGYHINLYNCRIIENTAIYGGGAALQIPHYFVLDYAAEDTIKFQSCFFIGNKAKVSAALDINGESQKLYQSFDTGVGLYFCHFVSNVAGYLFQQSQPYTKLLNAVVFAVNIQISFYGVIYFSNNKGTVLYLINSNAQFYNSRTSFINNTGDNGGAILLADNSAINVVDPYLRLHFINNTAKIGGAISVLSSSPNLHYQGTCFFINNALDGYKLQFTFINNNATSGLGNDIFISTLEPCLQLYNKNLTAIFEYFTFSSNNTISTGPVTLHLHEAQLAPYPGLPYTMSITQLDQFNNNITNLPLFPISAQMLKDLSVKIDISYSIANNYIIVFKGAVGDKGTLLIQTTEYNASLIINVTLNQCPPGYIFQSDTCHCSHSTSLYYYGILHCVEDRNAVIATGLWAGYLDNEATFATADCVTSICDYHNSISNNYGEHILPLNYSLLTDHVCATGRTGVLCGTCIADYTTYLHSPNYKCGESTHCQYGSLLYIISEILPVTGIFLLILFFNINLTSGALYSFIFYAQIVNSILYQSYSGTLVYFFNALKVIYGIFDLDMLDIDQLSFCLFKRATIMDLMLIKYLTTLYALFLIIITILILRFNSYLCIKLCHKCGRRNIRGSIVNGLTAFLVLCYFHCLVITLHILVPSNVMGVGGQILKTVPLYNGDLSYMSGSHLNYVIPALICLTVIILPPPIILLSEPLLVKVSGVLNIRRNAVTYTLHILRMKLKPFLDSFQGCFKDNCRCFAGFFFLYRILLVLIPVYLPEDTFWNIMAKEILLCLILLLQIVTFPFEKKWHNHIKSFLLVDLLMINTFQLAPLTEYGNTDTAICVMAAFQLVLMSLPLVYLLVYIGGYYMKHFKKKKESSIKDVDDNDDLPHRLLSYNTFN